MTYGSTDHADLSASEIAAIQRQQRLRIYSQNNILEEIGIPNIVNDAYHASSAEEYKMIFRYYILQLEKIGLSDSVQIISLNQIIMAGLQFADDANPSFGKGHLSQIFDIFMKQTKIVKPANQSHIERDSFLITLCQLLRQIKLTGTILDDDQKTEIKNYLEKFKVSANGNQFNFFRWHFDFIDQTLTRIKQNSATDAAYKSGAYVLAALGHFSLAVGSGLTGLATPFFIGTIGAAPDLIKAVYLTVNATVPPIKYIYEIKFKPKKWYNELEEIHILLSKAFVATIKSTGPDENNSSPIESLLQSILKQDIGRNNKILRGLVQQLTECLSATAFSTEMSAIFPGLAVAQQMCCNYLVDLFHNARDPSLRNEILYRVIQLSTQYPNIRKPIQLLLRSFFEPTTSVENTPHIRTQSHPALRANEDVFLPIQLTQVAFIVRDDKKYLATILKQLIESIQAVSAASQLHISRYEERITFTVIHCVRALVSENILSEDCLVLVDVLLSERLKRKGYDLSNYEQEGSYYKDHHGLLSFINDNLKSCQQAHSNTSSRGTSTEPSSSTSLSPDSGPPSTSTTTSTTISNAPTPTVPTHVARPNNEIDGLSERDAADLAEGSPQPAGPAATNQNSISSGLPASLFGRPRSVNTPSPLPDALTSTSELSKDSVKSNPTDPSLEQIPFSPGFA